MMATPTRNIPLPTGDMSFTSSPHEANHQRHYLPAIEHARLEAALKGRPLPNVLPHSIEAGKDPYYIGNAYRRLQYNPWHLDTHVFFPFLQQQQC